ncbi:hypothetical protein Q5752_001782 [Cryptotrichosporon argae]
MAAAASPPQPIITPAPAPQADGAGWAPASPRSPRSPRAGWQWHDGAGPGPGPGPRSRRNSGQVVSISLSSRSRSRTPRGSTSVLPPGVAGDAPASGAGTPSKVGTPKLDGRGRGMADSWAPGVEEMDGFHSDGEARSDASGGLADDGRTWTSLDEDDDDDDDDRRVPDVLPIGMVFGEGVEFEGEVIVPAVGRIAGDDGELGLPLRRGGSEVGRPNRDAPSRSKRYEVVRQLGSGSYAVVYLVREIGGRKREYALKCLSKQDLQEEQLQTQLFEAHIHLSLPIHTNIVTLHQTLQTKRWLFLMLELCPGEDLFYWLEKSRDASPPPAHANLPDERALLSSSRFSSSTIPFSSSQLFSNFSAIPSSFGKSPNYARSPGFGMSPASLLFAHHNGHHDNHSHSAISHTPPTPSLLSSFSAGTLLTQRRLRLIASMFAQMCEAVAVCHESGVSHRDIKPENFICCDSVELEEAMGTANRDDEDPARSVDYGPQARQKVVVKLTDFGLATVDDESGDVECGSKPYMSYECRNNLGPTYEPRPADVWSLGIVLINMLFHRNPWRDPTEGDPNFDAFLGDPVGFLQAKFTGIGKEVATYIADHVLCIDVEDRVSARELGKWVRALPEMIGGRRAIHALKMARLDTAAAPNKRSGEVMFAKSPVASTMRQSVFTSALTSSAPPSASLVVSTPSSAATSVASEEKAAHRHKLELERTSTIDWAADEDEPEAEVRRSMSTDETDQPATPAEPSEASVDGTSEAASVRSSVTTASSDASDDWRRRDKPVHVGALSSSVPIGHADWSHPEWRERKLAQMAGDAHKPSGIKASKPHRQPHPPGKGNGFRQGSDFQHPPVAKPHVNGHAPAPKLSTIVDESAPPSAAASQAAHERKTILPADKAAAIAIKTEGSGAKHAPTGPMGSFSLGHRAPRPLHSKASNAQLRKASPTRAPAAPVPPLPSAAFPPLQPNGHAHAAPKANPNAHAHAPAQTGQAMPSYANPLPSPTKEKQAEPGSPRSKMRQMSGLTKIFGGLKTKGKD